MRREEKRREDEEARTARRAPEGRGEGGTSAGRKAASLRSHSRQPTAELLCAAEDGLGE